MSAYYKEEQSFRTPWVWILLAVSILPVNVIMFFGFYKQILLGESWGSKPMGDSALIITMLLVLLFTLAIFWFSFSIKLILEIKDQNVFYQLKPLFKQKSLSIYDIDSWEVKPIRPIWDFGGYGLRITPKTRAYIVSGKHALFLRAKGIKQIAIDTNNPKELESIMEKVWRRAAVIED